MREKGRESLVLDSVCSMQSRSDTRFRLTSIDDIRVCVHIVLEVTGQASTASEVRSVRRQEVVRNMDPAINSELY